MVVISSLGSVASAATDPNGPLVGPALYGTSGWEVVPLPFAPTNDLAVACWTAADCVASDDGPGNTSLFLRTADGGVTWTGDGSYAYGIADISCIASGACMAVPFGGDPHLVVSGTAGSWRAVAEPPFEPPTLHAVSAACVPAFCIVTGGDENGNIPVHGAAAFLTTDFGTTWHTISLPPAMKDLQALACMPNGRCYLVYDTYTDHFSDMAASTDQGRTWVPVEHARGFTSLGGFSCPSNRSCVYLATQVLEVSTGSGPQWRNTYGPFSKTRASGAVSAFTLSCVAVTQCMIGGGIDHNGEAQQVVWIEAPEWTQAHVTRALRATDEGTTSVFLSAVERVASASGSSSVASAVQALLATVASNVAAFSELALHARSHQQESVARIGTRWDKLGQTLTTTSLGEIGSKLSADVEAITSAERHAGDRTAPEMSLAPPGRWA